MVGESELKQKHFTQAAKAFEAVGAVNDVEANTKFRALAGLGLAREELKEYKPALNAYETEMERYDTPGNGWLANRDTGRVTVRVTRSGNGAGASDVLISLDGKELRFTDADGVARFDGVTPGVHVMAIEERSLPANYEVVYASRVFVTVEPGRVPEMVRFAIARSERRSEF